VTTLSGLPDTEIERIVETAKAYALSRGARPQDVEDVAQDTMVVLLTENLHAGPLGLASGKRTQRIKWAVRHAMRGQQNTDTREDDSPRDVMDDTSGPSNLLELKDSARHILSCLTKRQREAWEYRVEGLTQMEIAMKMGCSHQCVSDLLRAAVKRLKGLKDV
jgi:RNA polymerase sigma factor (sigma-70 family)